MQLTWIVGGIGSGMLSIPSAPGIESATQWISAWAVGGVGCCLCSPCSFSPKRCEAHGWDYGARNDFQLEVGFANLAGVVAILISKDGIRKHLGA